MIRINETPVRTSRNFNINNITLENIKFPKKVQNFENVSIVKDSDKISIDDKCSDLNLTYGLGEDFQKEVQEKANQKLHITIDSKTEKQAQIDFKLDQNQPNLVENIEITANENTNSTIILKYKSENDAKCYHNGVLRVNAKTGAKVKLVYINLLNNHSKHFMSIQNNLAENAKIEYVIIDFGGKSSITNYYANLVENSSENKINTIYLGKNDQIFDLNYIGHLRGEKTNIKIEVQGALKDIAKKHFKGTIDFKKGAKKAKGDENEACMLLSDTAKSIALPMLLCSEEDVEGNHSSSAGKVGEKELFYLMSRGFSKKEAMKLMVKAKFNRILEKIKEEELKEEILNEIEERLD